MPEHGLGRRACPAEAKNGRLMQEPHKAFATFQRPAKKAENGLRRGWSFHKPKYVISQEEDHLRKCQKMASEKVPGVDMSQVGHFLEGGQNARKHHEIDHGSSWSGPKSEAPGVTVRQHLRNLFGNCGGGRDEHA